MIDSILNKLKKLDSLSLEDKDNLKNIRGSLKEMNLSFSQFLSDMNMESNILIEYITKHYLKYSGKQLRPFIFLYFLNAFELKIEKRFLELAMCYELLHISTLYHDDVMDRALYRRYVPSVNNLYGDKLAILAGDLLLSYVGSIIIEVNEKIIQLSINEAFKKTVMGQLYEIGYNKKFYNLTEDFYFKIIQNKTAAIFQSIFFTIGVLVQVDESKRNTLKEIGFNFGIAFQIMDDLLDIVSSTEKLGKDTQNDIDQSTLTLPAVYAIKHGEITGKDITELQNNPSNKINFYKKLLKSKAFANSYRDFSHFSDEAIKYSKLLDQNKFTIFLSTILGYMKEKLDSAIESKKKQLLL